MEKLDSCGIGCRVLNFRLFWKLGRHMLARVQPGGYQIEIALNFSLYLLSVSVCTTAYMWDSSN